MFEFRFYHCNNQIFILQQCKIEYRLYQAKNITRNDQHKERANIKNYNPMKLVEQQLPQPHQIQPSFPQKNPYRQASFLAPFKTFQRSVYLSLAIHFVRFLLVFIIYYYLEVFLSNPKSSSEPWNSLIYFLAIMIDVIRFVGDVSLKNLLKKEENKLISIHQSKFKTLQNSLNPSNTNLKGAKYEDYMSIFNMVDIFKYKHKNYSSAFSMSKYMHVVCTFLLFGWMSLREQYSEQNNWIQLSVLCIFLYSIYFTSFQMDLYLIETSEGRFSVQQKYSLPKLSPIEADVVRMKFFNWRKHYLLFVKIGSIALLFGILAQSSFSLYAITASIVLLINQYGYKLEKSIQSHSYQAIQSIEREKINTYSVLKKSTATFDELFKLFIIFQRASLCFLCFAFARDQSLNYLSLSLNGFGIIFLIIGQTKKIENGNKLKLMTIIQNSYSPDMVSQPQSNKECQCAICLNPFQFGQKVKMLPCSKEHKFHSECFDDWKKIKTQCPLCRYPLSQYL